MNKIGKNKKKRKEKRERVRKKNRQQKEKIKQKGIVKHLLILSVALLKLLVKKRSAEKTCQLTVQGKKLTINSFQTLCSSYLSPYVT